MKPVGKAHMMLQIAIPQFTHLFRNYVDLVFFPCCWGLFAGRGPGSLNRLYPSSYATVTAVTGVGFSLAFVCVSVFPRHISKTVAAVSPGNPLFAVKMSKVNIASHKNIASVSLHYCQCWLLLIDLSIQSHWPTSFKHCFFCHDSHCC